jgi:hypothetical protein
MFHLLVERVGGAYANPVHTWRWSRTPLYLEAVWSKLLYIELG